ncbi:hypothetical protein [Mucilaginibacter ginkgonis]|uniref:Uncharacterized protein n=1 Tax=Mucilaginibacter ginkgonis TaxID=2682091 RepID=A0A6I4HXN0_9SPHI|nr:hypothetical protein [Mucilaginibacter ginkgonis]QQL51089.1 hypothetical protein GO620_006465 [Mucilaginibacter ginkgonis]
MSLWSVLGSVGKGVAKVGLGVVGGVTGVNINGMIGWDGSGQAAAVTQASAPPPANPVLQSSNNGSFMDAVKGLFNSASNFLSGNSHAQVDVNTGVGGRAGDPQSTSGLPSWLLPVGLAAGGVFLISSLTKSNKRY